MKLRGLPGEDTLIHSHLPIQHQLNAAELNAERRSRRRRSPAWLVRLVDDLAQLFEPFSGVARAGYECLCTDERWDVAMFLGSTEFVGGPQDGSVRVVNFQFDLAGLYRRFERVDLFQWSAFPDGHIFPEVAQDGSFVLMAGLVDGQQVRLQIHAVPPDALGPALRKYADGSILPAPPTA